LLLLFALHVYRWHWPHDIAGAAREWPLLAAALGVGAVAGWALPRVLPRVAGAGAAPGALAAAVTFVALQTADPFVARRAWIYAPEPCDFAVAFARRPDIVAGEARLGAEARPVRRAVLTDVGEAASWSAECVGFARPLADGEKAPMLDAAEAQLKAAAARLGLKIERVARAGNTIALAGFSDEGRTAANEVLVRRAEARAVLGSSSLLVLWAWKLGRAGDATPFAEGFLSSVRAAR